MLQKKLFLLLLIFSSTSFSCSRKITATNKTQVDICIYGGTSAGVMAAYTARKQGKTVLLIEPSRHLGGLSSGGLGNTDIGNKYAVTGLALDFYRRLGKHYGKLESWIFEPHVAENLFLDYVKRGDVEVLYNNRLVSVLKNNEGYIQHIVVENSAEPGNTSNRTIQAKVFIDATYEGDLMAKAGVSYTVGREANSVYQETFNGVQLLTRHQIRDGIDPYKIPGKPESGLLWGISPAQLEPQGSGDKKIQAYNFRICLTNDPDNMRAITRPAGYDSTRYELMVRILAAERDKKELREYFGWGRMPNNKTDINNRGGFSTDMIGMNYSYPEGSYAERARIIREHEMYTKGLLYFFGHDPRVPAHIRQEMLSWGYPKDEYTDNDNWSPQLYIQEARRMIGDLVMTQKHCEGKEVVTDGVGMAAYSMDSHNTQRLVVNGNAKNEGNVEEHVPGPYPISYRALTPKQNECKNLLVPVCLSASHIAYGSIRMEPVFMVLGQSAAIAAAMAIDNKVAVQQIDVKRLQATLISDPLMDGSLPDILVDNEDKAHVKMTGEWDINHKLYGRYGPSLLTDSSESSTVKTVRFSPDITRKEKYQVYFYYTRMPDAASKIPIRLFDGKQLQEIPLMRDKVLIEGQTTGAWALLGTFELSPGEQSYVEVYTEKADGVILADAVLFKPMG